MQHTTLRPTLASALALSILSAGLHAQGTPGAWSEDFDRPGLVGRVFSLADHAGSLYAGGDSLWGAGMYHGDLTRFDGSDWVEVSGAPNGDVVRDLLSSGSNLFVAGDFTVAGGQAIRSVARYDGSQWFDVGGGIQGEVFDLELWNGELYAAGMFSQAGGQAITGIARFDGTAWQPVGGPTAGVFGSTVWALESGPDGQLWAGGAFDSIGGAPVNKIGSWDGSSWVDRGVDLLGTVRVIETFQGRIHAGGSIDFTTSSNENLVAWNGSGWDSLGGIPDWSISTSVYSLAEYGGALYVGGNFDQAGSVLARAIARWDGSQWSSIGGVEGAAFLNTTVLALAEHEGRLFVGGEFDWAGTVLAAGQVTISLSVAAFDGSGWSEVGNGMGFDAEVRGATLWKGGLAAVGRFTQAGRSLTGQVSFFDGTDWRFLGIPNQSISACIVFEGDGFSSINGVQASGIARYDGNSWSALGTGAGGASLAVYQGQLYAGGTGGFRIWDGTSWGPLINAGMSYVQAMHVHDGLLYVGGSASSANERIFSWDGSTLTPLGSGVDDIVECMVSYEGDLLVGGRFSTAGGAPANILARWDGSSWSEFSSLSGTLVKSLTVHRGELYAGGDLVLFSGNPADWIARWDGAAWQPLGLGLNGTPFTLVSDAAAGRLYVGGLFTLAEYPGIFGQGIPSYYMAAWDSTADAVSYCTAGTSASGCQALLTASGVASASSSSGFFVSAAGSEGSKDGLFFFGTSGRQANPWGNGTSLQCVVPPVRRGALLSGVGTLGACDGTAFEDLNARWTEKPSQNPGAGALVQVQYWYRDPLNSSNQTTSLSDAVEVLVGP